MDIKTLLLKSLSLNKPIHRSQRIYCGKSCFIINYTINGKILSIKTIKIERKPKTWSQYIKFYQKAVRIYSSRDNNLYAGKSSLSIVSKTKLDKETLTEHSNTHAREVQTEIFKNSLITTECYTQTHDVERLAKRTQTEMFENSPITKDGFMQTANVEKLAKEVQTETFKNSPKLKEILKFGSTTKSTKPVQQNPSVSLTTTAQQTIASVRFCRYPNLTNHRLFGLKTISSSCQTVSNTECKAIQCKKSTQEKASNTDIYTKDSFAQVENDLLTENTSLPEDLRKHFPLPAEEFGVFIYMLNEIGETVINQNQILKSNTEMMKQIIQISLLLQSTKRINHSSCSSISVQTDSLASIEKKDNFSQTAIECTKERKLLIFKGRSKQRKQMEKF